MEYRSTVQGFIWCGLEGCICLAVWLLQVIFSRNPAPAVHYIGCGCVVANMGELGAAKEITGPQHLEDPWAWPLQKELAEHFLEECVFPGSTKNSLERFSHAHSGVQRLWDPRVLHVTVYCVRIFHFFPIKLLDIHLMWWKFLPFSVKPMSPRIFKILFSLVIWKHILQLRRIRLKVTHYIIHNIVRKRLFFMHCIEIWTSIHFFGWQKKCLS